MDDHNRQSYCAQKYSSGRDGPSTSDSAPADNSSNHSVIPCGFGFGINGVRQSIVRNFERRCSNFFAETCGAAAAIFRYSRFGVDTSGVCFAGAGVCTRLCEYREHARVYVQCQQIDVAVDDARSLSLVAPRVHRGSVIRGRRELKGMLQLCTDVRIKTREVARALPAFTERSRTSFLRTRNECFSAAVVSARRVFNVPKEKKHRVYNWRLPCFSFFTLIWRSSLTARDGNNGEMYGKRAPVWVAILRNNWFRRAIDVLQLYSLTLIIRRLRCDFAMNRVVDFSNDQVLQHILLRRNEFDARWETSSFYISSLRDKISNGICREVGRLYFG